MSHLNPGARARTLCLAIAALVVPLCLYSCGRAYKDMSTQAGQQAIIDQANDFLTAGNCEGAIGVLSPLVNSPYVDYDSWMVYSSAYACRGGMNMAILIGNLKNMGTTDIWGTLIKSNYSNGNDGHLTALDQAVAIIGHAANPVDFPGASARNPDQNVDVIFLETEIIATVISPLGIANSATGKKGVSITGKGTLSDKCHVQVAFAETLDSLKYVATGTSIDTVSKNVNQACQTAFGGPCPTNESLAGCLTDGTNFLPNAGAALINAIDGMWN